MSTDLCTNCGKHPQTHIYMVRPGGYARICAECAASIPGSEPLASYRGDGAPSVPQPTSAELIDALRALATLHDFADPACTLPLAAQRIADLEAENARSDGEPSAPQPTCPPRPTLAQFLDPATLVRYGIVWPLSKQGPILHPLPDGYWTPWHLAEQRIADLEQANARLTQELENARTDYVLLSDDYKQLGLDLDQARQQLAEAQRTAFLAGRRARYLASGWTFTEKPKPDSRDERAYDAWQQTQAQESTP